MLVHCCVIYNVTTIVIMLSLIVVWMEVAAILWRTSAEERHFGWHPRVPHHVTRRVITKHCRVKHPRQNLIVGLLHHDWWGLMH